ncbi:MAG: ribokinase [Chloroflexi bacterium]|nr:ribokinase [Chloroflexota bacterium]
MSRVVVVGSLNLDIVMRLPRIPRPGETVHGGRIGRYPGGKGANQAVAAARAGAAVAMVGAVGRDDAGDALLRSLAAAGVDRADVRRNTDAATGTAMIVVDSSGANAIALAEGANLAVRPEDAARAVTAHDPAVVAVQREVPDAAVRAALSHAPAGAIRVMNAAPLEPDAILPLDVIDLLVVNEIEASDLLGSPVTSDDAPDAARRLAAGVTRGCVITLGGDGLAAWVDRQALRLHAHPVNVVDTTGAGDAFCGAMAAALALGKPMPTALAWGNAAGALAASRPGAQPSMPTRAEIAAQLATSIV